ncbi:MAG TPA: class I SAM-dependent methyltransferase [Panacibacter sp.]|nr:class I SAM-dependent methyltransferase [Panacibacter sp.]HNP43230.1 class I SAM-dependent methyltransferase [Panacibacter sp.]
MTNVISYSSCPVCGSRNIQQALRVTDHTVSSAFFDIYHCQDCTARFTQDVPAEEEIGAYYQSADYVSHSDTKRGLINRLYHLVRSYTLRSKKNLVEKENGYKKGSLLDVGAGTGAFAAVMEIAGWKVTGLEPDETARANAQRNHQLTLLKLTSLYSLQNSTYDTITLWHVLEHVHQLHEYLDRFHNLLKPGGTLVIAVPNYTSGDATHYQENWAAYDVPRHLYHFSPQSMKVMMEKHGFKVTAFKPMWFDSFYVSMLSEKYKTGHNRLLSALWTGCTSNIAAITNVKKCSSVIYVMKKAR